ncbi:helix-turn-helix domain-containing protein [Endozoicomonas gorgoniicola]|uniref:Helix-turn-helix domain-containing protein n=1 Tax=Endozoicomonas gorgoniicola TaxID=1234144 RepID=A0ABT3MTI9_9GAMM|nr:helix-turn-helix transcriptional regulator [Endozoicomonas gorgoniicola]MCW7552314.1 helix-turn-helix domain-containing protein [Endozoicomonas gorgoniicola]
MKTQEELAQALQHHRKAKGLGQKDMRLKIGMSQQQYQRAETGSDLRISTLLRILEGLDLELQIVPRQQVRSSETVSPDPVESYFESTEKKESSWQAFMDDLED